MIAHAPEHSATPRRQQSFLSILPQILKQANYSLRGLPSEAREEALQEVVANCFVAFQRLIQLGKPDLIYPAVLAKYAVAQHHAGRRVGSKTNTSDVCSPAARRKHGHIVERLSRFQADQENWEECLVEDRTAGPAATATARIDYAAWLRTLSPRNRQVASLLAQGDSTRETAQRFGISKGRVSQLRRELAKSWEQFHGTRALHGLLDAECGLAT